MRLTQRFPALEPLAIFIFQLKRSLAWSWGRTKYATERSVELLPVRVTRHQSLLMRKLGVSDPQLQKNKITNLTLAANEITTITIKPGETFSIWKLVGKPTVEKGYLEGLLLSNGEVTSGIGGGLCQMANLLYWMFLHTPLVVSERHHHSFDAFPDSGRVLPFGTGATLFYNYVDLQCTNPTDRTFQIVVSVTDEHLKGEIRCDAELPYSYHVYERNHAFIYRAAEAQMYRTNEVFRDVFDLEWNEIRRKEFIMKNWSVVKYQLPSGTPFRIEGEASVDALASLESLATMA